MTVPLHDFKPKPDKAELRVDDPEKSSAVAYEALHEQFVRNKKKPGEGGPGDGAAAYGQLRHDVARLKGDGSKVPAVVEGVLDKANEQKFLPVLVLAASRFEEERKALFEKAQKAGKEHKGLTVEEKKKLGEIKLEEQNPRVRYLEKVLRTEKQGTPFLKSIKPSDYVSRLIDTKVAYVKSHSQEFPALVIPEKVTPNTPKTEVPTPEVKTSTPEAKVTPTPEVTPSTPEAKVTPTPEVTPSTPEAKVTPTPEVTPSPTQTPKAEETHFWDPATRFVTEHPLRTTAIGLSVLAAGAFLTRGRILKWGAKATEFEEPELLSEVEALKNESGNLPGGRIRPNLGLNPETPVKPVTEPIEAAEINAKARKGFDWLGEREAAAKGEFTRPEAGTPVKPVVVPEAELQPVVQKVPKKGSFAEWNASLKAKLSPKVSSEVSTESHVPSVPDLPSLENLPDVPPKPPK